MHSAADMTGHVSRPRFLISHRAHVACRGLVGLVGATLVVALLPGAVAAQHAQRSAAPVPELRGAHGGQADAGARRQAYCSRAHPRGGPAEPMTVTDFEWSSDGRYLGWDQSDLTTGRGAVGWYDTVTHRRAGGPSSSSFPRVCLSAAPAWCYSWPARI